MGEPPLMLVSSQFALAFITVALLLPHMDFIGEPEVPIWVDTPLGRQPCTTVAESQCASQSRHNMPNPRATGRTARGSQEVWGEKIV